MEISVEVLHHNRWSQTAAGVEFLPSRQYDADLTITLYYGFLKTKKKNAGSFDLQPYFSEDQGETWFPVENYTIHPFTKTITFDIDHFTQYGWGLGEDED